MLVVNLKAARAVVFSTVVHRRLTSGYQIFRADVRPQTKRTGTFGLDCGVSNKWVVLHSVDSAGVQIALLFATRCNIFLERRTLHRKP